MKVNLFSIGAMRAGSITIYHYLNQHPEIFMSPIKEPYYFVAEYHRRKIEAGGIISQSEQTAANRILNSGKYRTSKAYQTLFEGAESYTYIGEGSHYLHHPLTAKLIHEHNPVSKVIISLRNPIDRIYSEYLLYLRDGKIDVSFSEFIKSRIVWNEENNTWQALRLNKGFYSTLVPPWLRYFGKDNVKIFIFEDIVRNPIQFCHQLYSWLGINSSFQATPVHAQRSGKPVSNKLMAVINSDSRIRSFAKTAIPQLLRIKIRDWFYKIFLKKENMDRQTREILETIYREDINQLEHLISRDLSAWKSTCL
ncbi:sulfotransferase [Desulfococcaceae bacterium HSG7]|nr:sulfotransferase [Desulfococcaceae bacterium HSG7]